MDFAVLTDVLLCMLCRQSLMHGFGLDQPLPPVALPAALAKSPSPAVCRALNREQEEKMRRELRLMAQEHERWRTWVTDEALGPNLQEVGIAEMH